MFKSTKLVERALERSREEVREVKELLVTDELVPSLLTNPCETEVVGFVLNKEGADKPNATKAVNKIPVVKIFFFMLSPFPFFKLCLEL